MCRVQMSQCRIFVFPVVSLYLILREWNTLNVRVIVCTHTCKLSSKCRTISSVLRTTILPWFSVRAFAAASFNTAEKEKALFRFNELKSEFQMDQKFPFNPLPPGQTVFHTKASPARFAASAVPTAVCHRTTLDRLA